MESSLSINMCEPGDYSVESKERPIFRELTADDDNPEVTEIESLCMTCGNNVSNGFFAKSRL